MWLLCQIRLQNMLLAYFSSAVKTPSLFPKLIWLPPGGQEYKKECTENEAAVGSAGDFDLERESKTPLTPIALTLRGKFN